MQHADPSALYGTAAIAVSHSPADHRPQGPSASAQRTSSDSPARDTSIAAARDKRTAHGSQRMPRQAVAEHRGKRSGDAVHRLQQPVHGRVAVGHRLPTHLVGQG